MNAERRNHHHRNYREVQKHDDGLAPVVLPKAPHASQPSAKQKTYPHGHFEDKNDIGAARCGRLKEGLYQQIVSTQNTDCVPFVVRPRVSLAERAEFILAIKREVLRPHIDVAHEQLLRRTAATTPKASNFVGTRSFDVTPQSP